MRYWLNRTGAPEGPLEVAQILELVRRGEVHDANVCPEGGSAWTPLRATPPFAEAMRPAGRGPDRKRILVALAALGGLLAIGLGCVGIGLAVWLWPKGELEVELTSTLVDGEVVYTFETEPGTEVRMMGEWVPAFDESVYLDGTADDEGRLVLRHPQLATANSIEVVVDASDPDDVGRRYHLDRSVAMPPNLDLDRGALRCRGAVPDCSIAWNQGSDDFTVTGPPGATVTVGGRSHTLQQGERMGTIAFASVAEYAAGVNAAHLIAGSPFEARVPVRLRAGEVELEGELAREGPALRDRFAAHFARITQGPVALPGEGTGDVLVWMDFQSRSGRPSMRELIGTPRTLADIRFIATSDMTFEDVGVCRYGLGGRVIPVTRSVVTWVITLYDRRTGRQVAAQHFRGGQPTCPRSLAADRRTVFGPDPSPAGARAWLTAQVAAHRRAGG